MAKNEQPEKDALEQQVDEFMEGREGETASADASEAKSAPELADDENEINDEEESTTSEETSETSETGESEISASNLDDDETDEAVDDITKSDGDEALAALDQKASADKEPASKPNIFRRWWASRKWRYGTLALILILILAALAMPTSRYWIFNICGARAEVSLTVYDSSTNLPLPDASVTLAGQTETSGKNGAVEFASVKLGPQNLTVTKPAFASASRKFTANFGNNQLGKLALEAVGIQYKLTLTDYLTGQPVAGAEVTSGQASALSNAKGLAVLSLMQVEKSLAISVKASGYNNFTGTLDLKANAASAELVPAGRDYFVSNASGKYDLDSANLDGSDRQTLLAGTGLENSNDSLTASNTGLLALVSIRDNQRDSSGQPLQSLTIFNTKTSKVLTLDHAENISLLGWLDGSTITWIDNNCGNGQPVCYSLNSYDYTSGARNQLATASYFASIETLGERIYYAATTYQNNNQTSVFTGVNSDGTNSQTLLTSQVYSVYRPSYNTLLVAALGQWYSYTNGAKAASPIAAPSNPELNQYADSPDGSKAAWVDQRDGQPVLEIYDKASGKNTVVVSLPGLTFPLRWLNSSTLIFRIAGASETADYVVSLNGGTPKKIVDVTDASGANGVY